MLEFARENERSELTGELIGDTLDDALADDGDAEAEDKIVSQVGSEDHCMRVPGSRLRLNALLRLAPVGTRILAYAYNTIKTVSLRGCSHYAYKYKFVAGGIANVHICPYLTHPTVLPAFPVLWLYRRCCCAASYRGI